MKLILAIIIGIVAGFLVMGLESLFISRSDEYRNSGFTVFLWKVGWWIFGFLVGSGMFLKYYG
jgi:hypothetical protein